MSKPNAQKARRNAKRTRRRKSEMQPVEALEVRRLMTTFTVTDLTDNSADPGSIRYAFDNLATGSAADTNTIQFSSAVCGQTIALSNGPLSTKQGVMIDNTTSIPVTISGEGSSTVLIINDSANVSISGLTITDGDTSTFAQGGAISVEDSSAELTLVDSTISGNTGDYNGGAIFNNYGTVNIEYSTVSGNSAQYAGAIEDAGGSLTITDSTVANNHATDSGGLPGAGGVALLAESSSSATLNLSSSTFSGNTAANSNSAYDLWLGHGVSSNTASATMVNTILASAPLTSPNIPNVVTVAGGSFTSDGYNISTDSSFTATTGDQLSTDPKLGALTNNGGMTDTLALLSGSPALNAGDNSAVTGITDDQRGAGFPRIIGRVVDIGAYEYSDTTFGVTDTVGATTVAGHNVTYTISLTNAGMNDATNVDISEIVPTGTTFVSATEKAGDPVSFMLSKPSVGGTGTITGTVADLPAGDTAHFTFVDKVSASSTPGAQVSDAFAASGLYAPDVSASATTTVLGVSTIHASDLGGVYDGKPFPATGYIAGEGGVHIATPVFTYYLASDTTFSHPLAGAPTDPGSYDFIASFAGNADYAPTVTSAPFIIKQATAVIHAADLGGPADGNPYPATGYVEGIGGVHIGIPVFTYYLASDTTHSHPLAGAPKAAGKYVFIATYAGSTDYLPTTTSAPFQITG